MEQLQTIISTRPDEDNRGLAPGYSDRKTLLLDDGEFVATYADSAFLDESGLQFENQELSDRLRSADSYLKATRIHLRSPRDHQRQLQTTERIWELIKKQAEVEESITDGSEYSQQDVSVSFLYRYGLSVMTSRLIHQQRKFSQQHNFEDIYTPVADLTHFMFCGDMDTVIGEIPLSKFVESKKEDSPIPYFEYVLGSLLVRSNIAHEAALANNTNPLQQQYPNAMKAHIEFSSGVGMSISNVQSKLMDQLILANEGDNREAFKIAKQAVEKYEKVTKSLQRIIQDPEHKEFSDIKEILTMVLNQDKRTRITALHALGINHASALQPLYRKSLQHMQEGIEEEFYTLISGAILDYASESPSDMAVLTHDDVPTLLNDEAEFKEDDEVSLDSLRRTVSSIFSNTSIKGYSIDPTSIDFASMVAPESVYVNFSENSPQKFHISMEYTSETGESLWFIVHCDTKNAFFDWNILDDPDSIPEMKDAALRASQGVLNEVLTLAENIKREKAQSQQTVSSSQQIVKRSKNKEHYEDEVYKLRKEVKAEARQFPSTALEMVVLEQAKTRQDSEIQSAIVYSEDDVDDLFKRISSVDVQIVKDGIERFNEKGLGKFQMLKSPSPDGELQYTLEVSTTVPHGVRVLMREVETEESDVRTRKFEVVDIKYRKDIYRKM